MDATEWSDHFSKLLEEEVDSYLKEHADELFTPSPLQPIEVQIQQAKRELIHKLSLGDSHESNERALGLIHDQLPQRISLDEWDACLEDFLKCEDTLFEFFEQNADGEVSDDNYIPLHQMLGISTQTLSHCYELGKWFYEEKNYDEACDIFKFLTCIAPNMPEFWISLGITQNNMGYYQEAIDTYQKAKELFDGNPAIHIHLANNHIANSDRTNAAMELDETKKIFDEHSDYKSEWGRTYDYLRSRIDEMYEKE